MPAVATAGGLPTRLGKYEIVTPLAAGGMARIYIARATGIGSFERHVVLKLITPERANDQIAVQMFLDEARLAASLNHQNVAQVFEVGEDAGIHYLAMEYVHGQDLRALLAKAGSQGTRVPLELALTVVAGAAAGLNHAHERRDGNGVPLGIVHRDVSPSNIMIGLDGAVKLLDFGIAKAAQRSVETVSGIIKGKFAYMSPEQCRGREVDRRSDVFSLGIILYEITTQHRCFRADSDFDTMHRIVTGDVVRPTRLIQGYPQALEAVVMKALAVDANQRYQSAGMLLEAIESYAVSARMSLSMMALGRFMRELFGETPEPWLTAGARGSNPMVPKESTISNTNGSSEIVVVNAPAHQGEQHVAGRTLLDLDLPPGARREPELDDNSAVVEWNAKSYPQMQPSYASTATLPPGDLKAPATAKAGRTSNPSLPALQVAPPQQAPVGTTPPPTTVPQTPPSGQIPPVTAFAAQPGSGSGPAHKSIGSGTGPAYPASKPGFASAASANDLSYPRYEPPADDSAVNVRVRPNRRPLVIGVAIVLIGIVVVVLVGLGGRKVEVPETPKAPPPTPTEDLSQVAKPPEPKQPEPDKQPEKQPDKQPEKAQVVPDKQPDKQVDAPRPPPIDDPIEEKIKLHVVSSPDQANVLLAGKPLGQTPLDLELPRGNGFALLTIQKAGYEEITTKIDLSGDNSKDIALVKLADKKPDVKKPDTKKPDVKKPDTKKPDVKKQPDVKRPPDVAKPPDIKKPDVKVAPCQPPNQVDPFDPRPPCSK